MRWPGKRGYGFGVELIPGSPAPDATRYYPPRWRLLVLALTCAFMTLLLFLPTTADSVFFAGIGWLGVTVFGIATLVLLARALRPGPTVLIDDTGIYDRTTLAPVGLVRWNDITVVRKREIGRGFGAERLLEVILTNPAAFRARPRNPLGRLIDLWRGLLKQPPVSIPGSMVSVPLSRVTEEIRRRRPQLQVLEGPPPPPPGILRRLGRRRQPREHPDLPRW
jgi:hypothetical protein